VVFLVEEEDVAVGKEFDDECVGGGVFGDVYFDDAVKVVLFCCADDGVLEVFSEGHGEGGWCLGHGVFGGGEGDEVFVFDVEHGFGFLVFDVEAYEEFVGLSLVDLVDKAAAEDGHFVDEGVYVEG